MSRVVCRVTGRAARRAGRRRRQAPGAVTGEAERAADMRRVRNDIRNQWLFGRRGLGQVVLAVRRRLRVAVDLNKRGEIMYVVQK